MARIARDPYHDAISPSNSLTAGHRAPANARISAAWRSLNGNGSLDSNTKIHAAEQLRGGRELRVAPPVVATAVPAAGGGEVDEGEGPRDVGVGRDGHPRIAPDQVEDPPWREAARGGFQRGDGALERAAEAFGGLAAREDAPDQPVQGRVVPWAERMGDDDVGHERGQRIRIFAAVLVHVDDDVGRLQRPDPIQARGLGAPYPRDVRNAVARVDAERGTPDHQASGPEVEEELGDARHQGDDPRFTGSGRVRRPGRIAQLRVRPRSPASRGFRGKRHVTVDVRQRNADAGSCRSM